MRSLGSHAAEAKVSGSRRRLDIFALDLLEEMTALHGSMVWRQVNAIPMCFDLRCFTLLWIAVLAAKLPQVAKRVDLMRKMKRPMVLLMFET